MLAKLKYITPTSWLVMTDVDERVGLLTTVSDNYTLMIKDVKQRFSSKQEVNEFFNHDIFAEVSKIATTKKTDCFINGYPARCESPVEILVAGETLPLYSKTENSDTYFSAGYYCIEFPKLVVSAFGPKYATLQAYPYSGPFYTEGDMKIELTRLKKEKHERDSKARNTN